MTRILVLLVVGFFSSGAQAQTPAAAFEVCAKEDGVCVVSAPSMVRYGDSVGGRWTSERQVTASIRCDNSTWGDPVPGKAKVCQARALPAPEPVVVQPAVVVQPLPIVEGAAVRLGWDHATANEDGTPLLDRTGYRIERAVTEAGPWTVAMTTAADATSARVPLLAGGGAFCLRVLTLSSSSQSQPSAAVCASSAASISAPAVPANAGVRREEFALVTGSASGLRAVYARTSTGSRGGKLGDLSVGPTAQTSPPFDRIRCSRTDSLQAGATMLYRVIDARAPESLRAGYVAGCVSYGLQ